MSSIEWPTGWERTPRREREPNNRFDTGLRASIDDLVDELERVGADDWRLSTDAEHQKQNPRYPYADASPEDPGAVVRWRMGGDQYAAACDRYSRLRDNVRSLYLWLREKRMMEDRPVVTGESEFANARLPPGEEDGGDVVEARRERDPYEVLGVSRGASDDVIEAAVRARKAETHPDSGGDSTEFKRVVAAGEEVLDS